MAKIKKISISSIDEVLHDYYPAAESFDWHGLEITVRRTISLEDMLELVDAVVESCFTDGGDFIPEVKELAFASNVISRYSNVTLPSDVGHQYDIICRGDLMNVIISAIDAQQIQEIRTAIDTKLQHKCNSYIVGVQNQLAALVKPYEDLLAQLEQAFKDISPEDVAKMAHAVGDGSIDEEKLVQAYWAKSKRDISEDGTE